MKRWNIAVEYERKTLGSDVWYWEVQTDETPYPVPVAAGRASSLTECFEDIGNAVDSDLYDPIG